MLFFKTAILLVMAGEASVMASIIGPAARDSLGYMQVSNSTSRGDDPEEAVPESDPNKKPLDSNMVHDELEHLCKKIEKLGGECVCKTAEPTTTSTATITSTTSTTTTTSTSVTSTAPCATPTCGSKGAKYFRYNNPFKGDYSDEYDSFDLEYFQSQTPLEEGVASTIYLKTDASNQTFNHAALQYQTFLFACKSGTYTFTSSGADDATLMWFGTDKVKDSTRQNADIAQFWYGDNSPKTVRKTIAANTYYPIRILWGNTEGAGFLDLRIFGPDGTELTGSASTATEQYLVTEPCDPSDNPFPPGGGGKPPQPSCGARKLGSGWMSVTGKTDMNACKALCEKTADCLSFSDSNDGSINNCYLYSKKTADVPAHPASDDVPQFYMYDRDCALPTPAMLCHIRKLGSDPVKSSPKTKLADCKALCEKTANCLSYCGAIDDSGDYCQLFDKRNAAVPPYKYSDTYPHVYMYDRDCPLPTLPTSCHVRKFGTGWIKWTLGIDLAACKAQCENTPNCKSFSDTVNPSVNGNSCYLYDKPAADVPTSPNTHTYPAWFMYNVDCPIPIL